MIDNVARECRIEHQRGFRIWRAVETPGMPHSKEGLKREIAADVVWDWIGNLHIFKSTSGYLVVVCRITPRTEAVII